MSTREQLIECVRELAHGTPYVVEDTESGFDVRVDVADATWYSLMNKEGLTKVFTHHVTVDQERRTLAVTDDSYTLTWKAGVGVGDSTSVPTVSGSAERVLGRVYEFGGEKIFAWDEKGRYGEVVSYRLNSREGHGLIRTAADQSGFTEKAGGAQTTGLVFAVIGGGIAVLVVLGLVIALLVR
jgi:hypothetical protein